MATGPVSSSMDSFPLLSRELSLVQSPSSGGKWPVRIFLPAVVMLYFFGYVTSIIVVNPIVYDKISAEYPKFHTSSQHPCANNASKNSTDNSTDVEIQDEIQKRVSTFELHLNMVTFILAVIPVLCLGPLSDRYGRKLGFLFPMVGTALKQVVFCLVVGLDLRLEFMFLGNICEALGGSFATMLMSMFSTISDVTVPGKQRSFLITFMEGLQTITSAVSQIVISRWMKTTYLYPLILAVCLEIIAFIITLTALPDTLPEFNDLYDQRFKSPMRRNVVLRSLLTGFRKVKNTLTLYIHDSEGRLAKRRLCLAVFILTVAVDFSKHGVQTLFLMKYPICWSNLKVIIFSGVQLAVNWVVIWLLLIVLQKLLKMKDRHVAIIGCVSNFMACVFLALAKSDIMVYEVAALGVMTRSIIPMMRSILSSIVDRTDQGAAFAGMGAIETLGAGVFGIVANRIYFATLSTFPGSVFLLYAGLMLLAVVLLVFLNVIYARTGEGVNQIRVDPDQPEARINDEEGPPSIY